MSRRNLVLFLALLPLAQGCSGGEAEKVHSSVVPASGKLLYADGRPVSNAYMVFHPKDPPGCESFASTESDGTFRVGTFGKDDGAVPGNYVVTVERHLKATTEVFIPENYTSEASSPLKVEIKKEGSNDLGTLYLR